MFYIPQQYFSFFFSLFLQKIHNLYKYRKDPKILARVEERWCGVGHLSTYQPSW